MRCTRLAANTGRKLPGAKRLGTVLKKLDQTEQKQTTQEQNSLS